MRMNEKNDAVSRDDFGRAVAAAAADLEYATTDAADELLNLAQGFHF